MASSLTVTEARATLPDVLDRVIAGEEVTITRHGHAVAVIVRPDVLRARRATRAFELADQARQALDAGRRSRLVAAPRLTEQRADELAADVRSSRAGR